MRRALVCALALGIAALAVPHGVRADDEGAAGLASPPPATGALLLDAPEPGVPAREEGPGDFAYRPRWGLLAVSAGLFVGFWAVGIGVASSSGEGEWAVPVAGPWLVFAAHEDDLTRIGALFLGIAQAASALLLVLCLVSPLFPGERARAASRASWDARPWIATDGAGLALAGTF